MNTADWLVCVIIIGTVTAMIDTGSFLPIFGGLFLMYWLTKMVDAMPD